MAQFSHEHELACFWKTASLSPVVLVRFSKQISPRLTLVILVPIQLWSMLIGIPYQRGSIGPRHKLQTIQGSHQPFGMLAKILVMYFQKAFILWNTFLPITVEIKQNAHLKSLSPVSNLRNSEYPGSARWGGGGAEGGSRTITVIWRVCHWPWSYFWSYQPKIRSCSMLLINKSRNLLLNMDNSLWSVIPLYHTRPFLFVFCKYCARFHA